MVWIGGWGGGVRETFPLAGRWGEGGGKGEAYLQNNIMFLSLWLSGMVVDRFYWELSSSLSFFSPSYFPSLFSFSLQTCQVTHILRQSPTFLVFFTFKITRIFVNFNVIRQWSSSSGLHALLSALHLTDYRSIMASFSRDGDCDSLRSKQLGSETQAVGLCHLSVEKELSLYRRSKKSRMNVMRFIIPVV